MALSAGLSGFKVDDFREEEKSIPIYMKDENSDENDIQTIESINIYSALTGKNVPLSQVADVQVTWQFAKIIRKDLKRTMTVGAYLKAEYTASDIFDAVSPWLEEQKSGWKAGYKYEFGGEDEDTSENLGAVFKWLPLSFFVILVLLVLQFNSIRKTVIVVSTIPLGIIGVVIGWYVGRSYASFFGILGVLSLAGIVINNAIILLDRIDVEKKADPSLSKQDIVIKAANYKFRPVVLTTLTTSMGMLPLLFGGGLLWEPLALAIIFGLFFATIITLLYVPVLYGMFYKVSFKNYNINQSISEH